MPAIAVVVVVLVAFFFAYRFYSRYLAEKIYVLDKSFATPAHEFEDGVDFVPTNKHVLFGHHFTSVAGAAPIVGPAIAAFWGWLPALLWITLGTIFAAGVHDFGSLVVSVRNRGQNIGTLSSGVISNRARSLFLIILFFLLTLVNAVFAVVIAILFVANPGAVIPAVAIIPIAIFIGQFAYRGRGPILLPALGAVALLYALIPVGQALPIEIGGLAGLFGLEPRTMWIILIFAYTWFASRLPVWLLLQPRDYINSFQLFVALGVIFLGIAVGFDTITAPAVNSNVPAGSPSIFPFLFITIACGAISGFHTLVASGTSSKQLDNEEDARYVGYMGALGEGSLALGSLLAVTAGLGATAAWQQNYPDFATASDGAVGYFTQGVGSFANNLGIPRDGGGHLCRGRGYYVRRDDDGHRHPAPEVHHPGDRGDHPHPAPDPQHYADDHYRGAGTFGSRRVSGRRPRRRVRLRLRLPVAAVRDHEPAHRRARADRGRGLGLYPQPQPDSPASAAYLPADDDHLRAGHPTRRVL